MEEWIKLLINYGIAGLGLFAFGWYILKRDKEHAKEREQRREAYDRMIAEHRKERDEHTERCDDHFRQIAEAHRTEREKWRSTTERQFEQMGEMHKENQNWLNRIDGLISSLVKQRN